MDDQRGEDLSQRDLSQVAEEDLTPEEQNELKRRFDGFLALLREKMGSKRRPRAKSKPKIEPRLDNKNVQSWDPPVVPRKPS